MGDNLIKANSQQDTAASDELGFSPGYSAEVEALLSHAVSALGHAAARHTSSQARTCTTQNRLAREPRGKAAR